MSLYDKISRLQRSPEPYKRRVLLLLVVVSAVVLVGAWGILFKQQIASRDPLFAVSPPEAEHVSEKEAPSKVISPFASLWAGVKTVSHDVQEAFSEIGTVIESLEEEDGEPRAVWRLPVSN